MLYLHSFLVEIKEQGQRGRDKEAAHEESKILTLKAHNASSRKRESIAQDAYPLPAFTTVSCYLLFLKRRLVFKREKKRERKAGSFYRELKTDGALDNKHQ